MGMKKQIVLVHIVDMLCKWMMMIVLCSIGSLYTSIQQSTTAVFGLAVQTGWLHRITSELHIKLAHGPVFNTYATVRSRIA